MHYKASFDTVSISGGKVVHYKKKQKQKKTEWMVILIVKSHFGSFQNLNLTISKQVGHYKAGFDRPSILGEKVVYYRSPEHSNNFRFHFEKWIDLVKNEKKKLYKKKTTKN